MSTMCAIRPHTSSGAQSQASRAITEVSNIALPDLSDKGSKFTAGFNLDTCKMGVVKKGMAANRNKSKGESGLKGKGTAQNARRKPLNRPSTRKIVRWNGM